MKRCVSGYLTYINDKNKQQRLFDFYDSLNSLSALKNDQIEFISIDNSSLEEVRNNLKNSSIFSNCFHYEMNHYDVALFYTTMWYAKDKNVDYICFLYDDSIIFDDAFNDVISFMDHHKDVNCVRIPYYDYQNQSYFNSEITPKLINPDSIRHFNFVTNKKLDWEGPFNIGEHHFYKNNWHYTSRPIIWRRDFFESILNAQGNISRILQGFEDWAQPAFEKAGLKTGVLDKGMVKTTPVARSARGLELKSRQEYTMSISVLDLRKDYENCCNNTR